MVSASPDFAFRNIEILFSGSKLALSRVGALLFSSYFLFILVHCFVWTWVFLRPLRQMNLIFIQLNFSVCFNIRTFYADFSQKFLAVPSNSLFVNLQSLFRDVKRKKMFLLLKRRSMRRSVGAAQTIFLSEWLSWTTSRFEAPEACFASVVRISVFVFVFVASRRNHQRVWPEIGPNNPCLIGRRWRILGCCQVLPCRSLFR